jgi:hypothetical protein
LYSLRHGKLQAADEKFRIRDQYRIRSIGCAQGRNRAGRTRIKSRKIDYQHRQKGAIVKNKAF